MILFPLRGQTNWLVLLASYLLGKDIQSDTVHDPVEDAFATLEIFFKYKEIFEEAVSPCSSKTATLQDELFVYISISFFCVNLLCSVVMFLWCLYAIFVIKEKKCRVIFYYFFKRGKSTAIVS